MKTNTCFFGHHWSQWKETENGTVGKPSTTETGKSIITGKYIVQERFCNVCKFKEIKSQTINVV